MRIAGVEPESVVDGPGVRFAVFTQGCALHCVGCQNPGTWDPRGGRSVAVGELMARMDEAPLATGLTLSGGEASQQPGACAELAAHAHRIGWDVWCWSGHTVEALMRRCWRELDLAAMLGRVDVLVDGPFLLRRRSLAVPWRGSTNQRLIDMPATLEAGHTVEWVPGPGSGTLGSQPGGTAPGPAACREGERVSREWWA